jgi:hypothetical protein
MILPAAALGRDSKPISRATTPGTLFLPRTMGEEEVLWKSAADAGVKKFWPGIGDALLLFSSSACSKNHGTSIIV